MDDFKAFNAWLLEEEKPTYKGVVQKLAELRHHRWATWHVMCPDNPGIDASCSMPCPSPGAFTCGAMVMRNWVLECFLHVFYLRTEGHSVSADPAQTIIVSN